MKHSRSASFETNGYGEPQSGTLLGDPLNWPSPASWTVPSRAYEYRTVSFNFSDPRMPGILKQPIQVRCGHLPTMQPIMIREDMMIAYVLSCLTSDITYAVLSRWTLLPSQEGLMCGRHKDVPVLGKAHLHALFTWPSQRLSDPGCVSMLTNTI